jgi:hypothetical protein
MLHSGTEIKRHERYWQAIDEKLRIREKLLLAQLSIKNVSCFFQRSIKINPQSSMPTPPYISKEIIKDPFFLLKLLK